MNTLQRLLYPERLMTDTLVGSIIAYNGTVSDEYRCLHKEFVYPNLSLELAPEGFGCQFGSNIGWLFGVTTERLHDTQLLYGPAAYTEPFESGATGSPIKFKDEMVKKASKRFDKEVFQVELGLTIGSLSDRKRYYTINQICNKLVQAFEFHVLALADLAVSSEVPANV